MVTREWSERHIVELIKKHGGAGDPIVSMTASTLNKQGSKSSTIPRELLIVINSQEALPTVKPIGTYYTVTNQGSANNSVMAPANFVTGEPFIAFMWPKKIHTKAVDFPFSFSSTHTLDTIAIGGSAMTDYVTGKAKYRIRMTSNWGSTLTGTSLSGVWGGSQNDTQRIFVLEIMDSGVQTLAQNYVNKYGENPKVLTAWHVNSPPPIPGQ